ncbi:MAG: hypothetical protein P4L30_01505, partial [Candidatus Limnocylindrales bacterium]|nr:hypothetical protein [Candidatus Limnocylindrales bacterium]
MHTRIARHLFVAGIAALLVMPALPAGVAADTQATLVVTGPASVTYGDAPFAPAVTGGSGTGAVTFDSSTSAVCTASGSSLVTI